MILHTFDKLIIRVPDNYKKHSQLDLYSTSTLDFDNEKCKVQLKESTKFQYYDFTTGKNIENNYTKEELYNDITLDEKIINGETWLYHNDKTGQYIYDYIYKNVNYQVTINSSDDEYCRVTDIVNSLIVKK